MSLFSRLRAFLNPQVYQAVTRAVKESNLSPYSIEAQEFEQFLYRHIHLPPGFENVPIEIDIVSLLYELSNSNWIITKGD